MGNIGCRVHGVRRHNVCEAAVHTLGGLVPHTHSGVHPEVHLERPRGAHVETDPLLHSDGRPDTGTLQSHEGAY